jgi:hypothetical protein
MRLAKATGGSRFSPRLSFAALSFFCLLCARDAPAHATTPTSTWSTTALSAEQREARTDSWAVQLAPVEVKSASTGVSSPLRLYANSGEVDEEARAEFERIAAREGEPHVLDERLEQLVFKAAYHFKSGRVSIVSGWRQRAGRHTAGEALDFRLDGVPAWKLAAYLRGLPRVGVGIYTHPKTQFVHLDVRDQSYHWLDASPPGVKWRERQLHDPHGSERDAAWTPENDLPL